MLLSFFSSRCEEKNKAGEPRPRLCRSDLNYPPTAVGGIWTFRTVSHVGGI